MKLIKKKFKYHFGHHISLSVNFCCIKNSSFSRSVFDKPIDSLDLSLINTEPDALSVLSLFDGSQTRGFVPCFL